jgi:hypothetical protein
MEEAEMKILTAGFISLCLFASAALQAQSGVAQAAASPAPDSHAITITRSGSQPSSQVPRDHMTGSVLV